MSTAHHPNSPSALRRRELCPASYAMEAGMQSETSEAAERGTLLHAAAFALASGHPLPVIETDDLEQVEWAVANARELARQTLGDQFREMLETEVETSDFHGTADYVAVAGEAAVVVDYKFGRGSVKPAAENIQIAAYALGIHLAHVVPVVTAAIIQPPLRLVSSHRFERFGAVNAYIRRVIDRATSDTAETIPGDEQCRYCKGFSVCPAARARMESAIAKVGRLDSILAIPTAALAALIDQTAAVVRFHENAKAALKDRIVSGETVPGWEVKAGVKRREADASELFAGLIDRIKPDDFAACCKVSIPQVETALAATMPGKTATERKRAAAEIIAPFIRVSEGSARLAKKGDE